MSVLRCVAIAIALVACGETRSDQGARGATPHDTAAHAASATPPGAAARDDEAALAAVAAVHGGAGPWAVAGYRMGQRALADLGLSRGSFDLEIEHLSPREVQFTCIADGAAAATGASVGKLNLALSVASEDDTRTVYRRKSTGQSITLRLTPAFKARYLDVPREGLAAAGREVIALREDEIFEAAE